VSGINIPAGGVPNLIRKPDAHVKSSGNMAAIIKVALEELPEQDLASQEEDSVEE